MSATYWRYCFNLVLTWSRSCWRYCFNLLLTWSRSHWRYCFHLVLTWSRSRWRYCFHLVLTWSRSHWRYCFHLVLTWSRSRWRYCFQLMPFLFSLMVGTVEQVSSREKYIFTLNVCFFVCFRIFKFTLNFFRQKNSFTVLWLYYYHTSTLGYRVTS